MGAIRKYLLETNGISEAVPRFDGLRPVAVRCKNWVGTILTFTGADAGGTQVALHDDAATPAAHTINTVDDDVWMTLPEKLVKILGLLPSWKVDTNGTEIETGTATGVTATTLTDTGKVWTVNAYAGWRVTMGGYFGTVISNTATVLTIDGWQNSTGVVATPAAGAYTINNVMEVLFGESFV